MNEFADRMYARAYKSISGSTHCIVLDTERVSLVDADMPQGEACTRCHS